MHGRVFGCPLPEADLHYDGSTYELGWDGRRTATSAVHPALPTADHALFLINTVKFHCGQLFHIFDNDRPVYDDIDVARRCTLRIQDGGRQTGTLNNF